MDGRKVCMEGKSQWKGEEDVIKEWMGGSSERKEGAIERKEWM